MGASDGSGVCAAVSSRLPCARLTGVPAAFMEFLVLRATGSLDILAACYNSVPIIRTLEQHQLPLAFSA